MKNDTSKNKTSKSANFQTLMRRLSKAGFDKGFVRPALLPDWWDETCEQDPNMLPDFEIRVARFLGMPLSSVRDPDTILVPPFYPGAQLRRVRNVAHERLTPAIHAAMQIAAATVRSFRDPGNSPAVLPADGLRWRKEIEPGGAVITLSDVLGDLWMRGIPVVPVDLLPAPSFQAIACIVEGRPVILLGYKHDEPGRVAFLIAHEAGHIAAGDCKSDHPVVDEEAEILDESFMEVRANRYANSVLVGSEAIPIMDDVGEVKQLARRSVELEQQLDIDAGAIISAWAADTGDYAKATMALKALYRSSGARQRIRHHFNRNVDLESANESDRNLLRCVYGGSELHETVD